MNQKILEDIKQKAVPILKEAGVTRSSIFGSYVRGEEREDSDIDFLVDFPKDKGLLEFIHLKNELEDVLHKKVDLVEYHLIKPMIKPYIMNDQIQIL